VDGRLSRNRQVWALAAGYVLLALALYGVLAGPAGLSLHPSYWAFAAATGLLALYLVRPRYWWALLLALACEAVGALTAVAEGVFVLPAAALIAGGLMVALRGLLRRPPAL
jgi:hypothetical protein